jgi:hypothetical protein
MSEATTTVVNMRVCKDPDVVKIDRTTIFGNPFKIGDGIDRKTSIKMYKEYFYWRISHDTKFARLVRSLEGKKLGCWCAPAPCHGDVIVEYFEELRLVF